MLQGQGNADHQESGTQPEGLPIAETEFACCAGCDKSSAPRLVGGICMMRCAKATNFVLPPDAQYCARNRPTTSQAVAA